jgi:hypothetical protein
MASDESRQQAEKSFKKEQRARDGRQALTEYEAQLLATREKTARLKALRLAKEARAQNEGQSQDHSALDTNAPPPKNRSSK